jgi:peptidoglycan-associated lipoprotein
MRILNFMMGASLLTLVACGPSANRELGGGLSESFGNATMNNSLIQSGQKEYAMALASRFAKEVPSTINFAFNSSHLDSNSIAILRKQSDWIKTFPEVRFRVYGHTDLVGTNAANQALGLRRANAVVAYFASQGISRSRLEAIASYGETRPVVQTAAPEIRNRRTVTEVSGFVKNHPALLNGKYAAVIHREYLVLAERAHPGNQVVATQTNPGQ